MKQETPTRILEILKNLFDQKPTGVYSTPKLADILKISIKEAQGGLIYLNEKAWIKSFQNVNDKWVQKISALGIDELQKIKSQTIEPLSHKDHSHVLDIDEGEEKFQGIMKVFISHKFIKEDQKLALSLQKMLRTKNINGYMAERKREYTLLIRDKIRKEIENSDYVIGIITKESRSSASVNQELGYALGVGIPLILLVEKGVPPGVLTHGQEVEEFNRNNFQKPTKNVISYILKNKPNEKITDENKKMLKEGVYIPLYNMMKKFDSKPVDLTVLPPNPWESLEAHQILTIEDDIKKLLDEYDSELEIWKKMFIEINEGFETNKMALGKTLEPAFSQEGLLEANGMIRLDERTTQEPQHWIDANKIIIFDNTIKDGDTLLSKLKEHTRRTNPEGIKYLKFWEEVAPSIFHVLTTYLPELWRALRIEEITHSNLIKQRDKLSSKISNLVSVLEEKIKN